MGIKVHARFHLLVHNDGRSVGRSVAVGNEDGLEPEEVTAGFLGDGSRPGVETPQLAGESVVLA